MDSIFNYTILLNLILAINCLNTTTNTTKRVSASLQGDFKIGILVSVRLHQPGKKQTRNLDCGMIRELYGIQRVEGIFQTIDKINSDPDLLKNITLGVEIRDTCWYAPIALQQSIELIRGSISPYPGKNTFLQSQHCANTSKSIIDGEPLIAIVGPASSSIALQVQNLLQLFSIPQIGYSTTSKDLSDKSRFSTFMRVVPSDYYQAQVMVDVVKFNNWTYIDTVHTDENYGQSGIQAFRELADKNGICIAREDSILSNDEDEKYQELLKNLDGDSTAKVIVCFCEGMTVRKLLMAMKFMNLTNRFLIIGSDGWADRQDVVTGYEMQAVGSISIRIHSPYLQSFDDYYFKLDPFENDRNPWFKEFWENKFDCKMPPRLIHTRRLSMFLDSHEDSASLLQANNQSIKYCTGKEKLSKNHKQEPKLSFLVKAIYTIAHALETYKNDICGLNFVGACNQLLKSFNHSLFYNYLMNVSYITDEKEVVEFNQEGDPSPRYDIMNFQMIQDGTYDYVMIGEWINHTLNFFRNIQSPPNGPIKSVCSKPCQSGYYKIFQETGGANEQSYCCWMCVACDSNEYLKNETNCERCLLGSMPNNDKTECIENPIEYMEWNDIESVLSTAFSILGITLSLLVLIIFISYNSTPVIKASTRELCYIILCGMIMSHLSIFAILAHPTVKMCTLTRLIPGISFSMIYGSLLIKTNRIARLLAISKKRFPTKKLRFLSPLSQVVLAFLLISIETIIAISMLFIEEPNVELKFPRPNQNLLVCKETTLTIITPLAFIFILIILCVHNAIRTRNVPENFNETKFVGFAIYTTCVIWIAFFPIYYGSEMQIITKCLCTSLSSIMTLIFIFAPKIYIILFHPEKNIRAMFTTSKSIRCHIGATRHSNISHKTSSSISSVYEPPSNDIDSSIHRSFKTVKTFISSSSQTSQEQLLFEMVNTASSPIRDDIFLDFFIPQKYVRLPSSPNSRNKPSQLIKKCHNQQVPTSSNNFPKIKKHKVHIRDPRRQQNLTQNFHPKIKSPKNILIHQNLNKSSNYSKPVLCIECLEIEQNQHKSLMHLESNDNYKEFEKSSIFTVEKLPLESNKNYSDETRKIAISEESLSECSISDKTSKLKLITIKLK